MAPCCLGTDSAVKEFTFMVIHVLHVSQPAAFQGSTHYARERVDRFLANIHGLMLVILTPMNINFVI
jgi:hypothetical protein